jgi:hypothetical protein
MAGSGVSEKPYELAYEASVRAIEDQATVLEGVQNRAGTVLAAAAVVMSFFGTQALGRAAHGTSLHLVSYASAAVGAFVCVALLVIAILLPRGLRFSLSAEKMLAALALFEPEEPVSAQDAYRIVAREHQRLFVVNNRPIRLLQWCLRGAILAFVVETILWVVVLERSVG